MHKADERFQPSCSYPEASPQAVLAIWLFLPPVLLSLDVKQRISGMKTFLLTFCSNFLHGTRLPRSAGYSGPIWSKSDRVGFIAVLVLFGGSVLAHS